MAEFGDLGLVTAVDQSALAAYCQSFARWQQAEIEVEQYGLTIKEPITSRYTNEITGYRVKKNPVVTVAQQERAAMIATGRLFGLDPASRANTAVPDQDHKEIDGTSFSDVSWGIEDENESESDAIN
jgi:P27 family predicted phage terminase small subunit